MPCAHGPVGTFLRRPDVEVRGIVYTLEAGARLVSANDAFLAHMGRGRFSEFPAGRMPGWQA